MSFLTPQHSADTLLIVPPRNRPLHQNVSSSDSELANSHPSPNSPQASPSPSRKNKLLLLQEKFRSFGHRENSLDVPKLRHSPFSTSETSDGDTSDGNTETDSCTPSPRPETSESKGFRFNIRRLRSRQKTISPSQYSDLCAWSPVDTGQWRNNAGIDLFLKGSRLDTLSEAERVALKRVAFGRLQRANLGCAVNRPKEPTPGKGKRQKYIKQVRKAQTLTVPDKQRDGQQSRVFGISLAECLENEQRNTPPNAAVTAHSVRCKSLELNDQDIPVSISGARSPTFLHKFNGSNCKKSERSSLSDQGSSSDSNPWSKNHEQGHDEQVLQAHNHDTVSNRSGSPNMFAFPKNSSYPSFRPPDVEPHSAGVPSIVGTCCSYLEDKGLNTIGLFRVAGSKKRCRELRMEIDAGQPMQTITPYSSDIYPHDVATLLKEYFRDLPAPLLTKELYPAFLAAAKISEAGRVEVLRLLMIMLPTVNTDTFYVLIRLLKRLSQSSYDVVDDTGVTQVGNKMNASNLATVFAPTILWPSNSPKQPCPHEENELAIIAVETMIAHAEMLFHVSVELQHEMLLCLLETEPELIDGIFRRLHSENRPWSSVRSFNVSDEEPSASMYMTSENEIFPQVVTKEPDGTTVIKCRETTTHRLVYKTRRTVDYSRSVSSNDDEVAVDQIDRSMNMNRPIDEPPIVNASPQQPVWIERVSLITPIEEDSSSSLSTVRDGSGRQSDRCEDGQTDKRDSGVPFGEHLNQCQFIDEAEEQRVQFDIEYHV